MEGEQIVRIVVACCITAFGITCMLHGWDHAVVATVGTVLGWVLRGKRRK
jgi:hypothetical protein